MRELVGSPAEISPGPGEVSITKEYLAPRSKMAPVSEYQSARAKLTAKPRSKAKDRPRPRPRAKMKVAERKIVKKRKK